jgi:putative colanic acid biosynthesis acetyltransferase WcaF
MTHSSTDPFAVPESANRLDPASDAVEGPLRIDLYRVPAPSTPREKLLRLLWALFQLPFLSCMPRALSPLRVALLRLFGARIGPACLIDRGVKVWMPWKLTMGERSSLGVDTEVYNFAPVTIGRHVVVSQYNYICTATHDYTDPFFRLTSAPIHIRSQSWIASGCLLAPGVIIGEGAVIGARSIVTKSMPAWMVCAGTPCKPIKPRLVRPMDKPLS